MAKGSHGHIGSHDPATQAKKYKIRRHQNPILPSILRTGAPRFAARPFADPPPLPAAAMEEDNPRIGSEGPLLTILPNPIHNCDKRDGGTPEIDPTPAAPPKLPLPLPLPLPPLPALARASRKAGVKISEFSAGVGGWGG